MLLSASALEEKADIIPNPFRHCLSDKLLPPAFALLVKTIVAAESGNFFT